MSPQPALAASTARVRAHLGFRIVAALIAVLVILGFSSWQTMLAPWLTLPDTSDHGWARTPELHRWADTASGLLMTGVGIAAALLALRPRGRTALFAWAAAMLVAMGILGTISAAVQGLDVAGAAIFSLVWLVVLVVPFVLLHPERRDLRRGGQQEGGAGLPLLRWALLALGVGGLAMAVAVVLWRLGGGVFENHREDDVVGLAMLGAAFAVGALLCVRRRTGWVPLAWLLAGMAGYATMAGISIAVG